jgi:nitroreductase/ferredoxin-like protein FixX
MNHLTINGINKDKCTVCLECVKDCPAGLFSQGSRESVVFADPRHSCIACSHCIAVCPADAIDYASPETAVSFKGISKPETLMPFDTLKQILLSRRSIRHFRETPVEEDKIRQILDLLRFAPSASNHQSWEYVVITDSKTREFLVQSTLKIFKAVRFLTCFRWLLYPFIGPRERKLLGNPDTGSRIRRTLEDYKNGKDPVLFHAPAVLILHSPPYGHLAGNDAGIALTYAMLCAQGLGLGTCWIGFVQEMFFMNNGMKKELGIPKGHSVWGVLAMGYPDVKYHRAAIRNPIKAKRIS